MVKPLSPVDSERLSELAESFPCLRGAPGVRPFDAATLLGWAIDRAMFPIPDGSGELACVRLVVGLCARLGFYEPSDDLEQAVIGSGGVSLDSLARWDDDHRQALTAWLADPWVPGK